MNFGLAILPGSTTGKKLDLSKLTDEEAQHVWAVVQRDFDLRKKEEGRLGDLKTKIEKEDTKRELLGNQTRLTESYCIRCLQPFKFLVNTKRQCLDCQLHICKSCSRYNKREHGWVCDPCHMARVLKIGTLEWYHENVRARFKRFGSAKVMRSLFKRLSVDNSNSQTDAEDPNRKVPSELHSSIHRKSGTCSSQTQKDGYEEPGMDGADSQDDKEMKKAKRRLTVDPIDFERECDYKESGQRSNQAAVYKLNEGVRESTLTEANVASVVHQILKEQRDGLDHQDSRTMPSRSISQLSYSSVGSGSGWGPQYSSSSYLPGPGDSSGEEDQIQAFPFFQSPQGPLSHASQESLNSSNPPPQISDLNRRVSAIENFLNHLEQKVASPYDQQAPPTPNSTSPFPQWEEADLEEQQLRQKLNKMADHISDQSESSEEEEEQKPSGLPIRPASRSSIISSRLEEHPTDCEKKPETDLLEQRWGPQEEGSKGSFRGSTALLFELEDKVAQAAASVQNSQSQVSYIEDRIAALNAAGMQGDRRRRSAIPIHARRLSHNPPTNTNSESGYVKRRLSIL